jgi:hypothetical protein
MVWFYHSAALAAPEAVDETAARRNGRGGL